MALDTELDPLQLPTQPPLAETILLPPTGTDYVDPLYSNLHPFGSSALGESETSLSLDDILNTSALYLSEDPTACFSTAKSLYSGSYFVDAGAFQPSLPEAGAPTNALEPVHNSYSVSLSHTDTHTSTDPTSNYDTTQPSTSILDAPSNAGSSKIACEVHGCGKTFRRPYLLRDHMRHHSGESNGGQLYLTRLFHH